MRILIIGATGYLGQGIAAELLARKHVVSGIARSDEARDQLELDGIEAIRGDVADAARLGAIARDHDAVIFAVQLRDKNPVAIERAAHAAIFEALAGTGKTFMHTSGVWAYGSTGSNVADEQSPPNATPLVAERPATDAAVLAAAQRGLRTLVIRAGLVYGAGRGIPAMLLSSVKERRVVTYVGDGKNHWAMIHRHDLALLFALAIEKTDASGLFNAVDDTYYDVRTIADAAARGAGVRAESWPLEQARSVLGPFADALVLDQHISNARAKSILGWSAAAPTIIQELESGSYVHAVPERNT